MEANECKCRTCGVVKTKIKTDELMEYRKNYKQHYYRDGDGRSWNGRQCPQCHYANIYRLKKVKRAQLRAAKGVL